MDVHSDIKFTSEDANRKIPPGFSYLVQKMKKGFYCGRELGYLVT